MPIPHRTLGKTGFSISEIGFGAWAIGGNWGETVNQEQAIETLHTAIDAGVNFIDTADVYGGGRSEELIGEVLKAREEEIFVATKMGRFEGWSDDYSAMETACRASMQRLGVDILDLTQLHCIPTSTLEAGEVFENLEKLKANGLIKHYGVSVETVDEGNFCIQNSGASTLQIIFNIFRQKPIHELFDNARSSNVGLIARLPLASGLLTGKFTQSDRFPEDDHRNFNANGEQFNVGETFAGLPFTTGVELASDVEDIFGTETYGSVAQKSLRWILDHDAISAIIPGAKKPAQANENNETAVLEPLGDEIHSQLADLYEAKIKNHIRGVY